MKTRGMISTSSRGSARALHALLYLVLALPTGAAAQRKAAPGASEKPPTATEGEKQRAAEEAADRLMRRFHETLDFGTVYRELFVSDPARRFEVSLVVDNKIDREGRKNIGFAAKERAYVAMLNFWWLASALRFTNDDPVAQSAALDELREPYEGLTRGNPDEYVRTDADLDEKFTAVFNRMSDVLRRRVSRAGFGTAEYYDKAARVKETQANERDELKELFAEALPKGAELYVVRREMHYLYLMEQNGEFRLLTYTSRRRF